MRPVTQSVCGLPIFLQTGWPKGRYSTHSLPAGYVAWRDRPESRWLVHNRTLLPAIRVIHRESSETYGSPSIRDAFIKKGFVSASTASRGSCVPTATVQDR